MPSSLAQPSPFPPTNTLGRYWSTGSMAVVMLSLTDARSSAQHAVTRTSRYSVRETMQRIEATAEASGLGVFARFAPTRTVSGEDAHSISRESRLLVLSSNKGVTPVVQAPGEAAIDLPLKVLVAESTEGTTEVTFHDSSWLVEQDGLPGEIVNKVSALPAVLDAALQ